MSAHRRLVAGLVGWLLLLTVAGYQYGRPGFGAVLTVSMALLFCLTLYQYRTDRRSRLELYRQGGNHIMLAGVGLLQARIVFDGLLSRVIGVAAVGFVCTGLALIATWWRIDRGRRQSQDRQL